MGIYKIARKGIFESIAAFEDRINALYTEGWRATSITSDNSRMIVLMERQR